MPTFGFNGIMCMLCVGVLALYLAYRQHTEWYLSFHLTLRQCISENAALFI